MIKYSACSVWVLFLVIIMCAAVAAVFAYTAFDKEDESPWLTFTAGITIFGILITLSYFVLTVSYSRFTDNIEEVQKTNISQIFLLKPQADVLAVRHKVEDDYMIDEIQFKADDITISQKLLSGDSVSFTGVEYEHKMSGTITYNEKRITVHAK